MNACFGVYQERKSEKAIENLKKMTQPESFDITYENKIVIYNNSTNFL